jgi:hypothetical protein
MHVVKYRLFNAGLSPRRTKMEMPGWGGSPQPRQSGSHEQPWHCAPFSEGAQYGIEVFYPYKNELRVRKANGQVELVGDFGTPPAEDLQWPPFRAFGENFYTYQLLLDLQVPSGWAVRAEPHPRFYTDETDTVPIAVPALVKTEWWPMISFVVFKAPPAGVEHIFRPGEAMMQFIVIPAEPNLELQQMTPQEAAEREVRSRRIHASRSTRAADSTWTSSTNTVFDGTYRHLMRAAKDKERGGPGQ